MKEKNKYYKSISAQTYEKLLLCEAKELEREKGEYRIKKASRKMKLLTDRYKELWKVAQKFAAWLEKNYPDTTLKKSEKLSTEWLRFYEQENENCKAIDTAKELLIVLFQDTKKKKRNSLMVELEPSKCNLCGGEVVFVSNSIVYGKEYGSGKCYYCTECGAFVGTHEARPKEAYGVLADKEMRKMREVCHEEFDELWINCPSYCRKIARTAAYEWLAEKLSIRLGDCHFGYFGKELLYQAYEELIKIEKIIY